MTLRSARAGASGVVALDYEIAQEQAAMLGRLGRALEAALAALSEHDRAQDYDQDCDQDCDQDQRANGEAGATRSGLVQEASDALWCFLVQRESIGLRDPRPVIREYRVPAEVQNRMGVFGGRRRASA
jgi:hypothetical protein